MQEEAHADEDIKKTLLEEENLNAGEESADAAIEPAIEEPAAETAEPVVETTEPVNDSVKEPVQEPARETVQEPEAQPKQEKQEPKEAIIIVKEKPILKIDDFSEDEPEADEAQVSSEPEKAHEVQEKTEDDGVSLKELAKKSIEARFEEVIGETKKAETSKNQLKINENVSIDLNKIKSESQGAEATLPIFNNEEPDEEPYEYEFQEGMRVGHQKYGAGSILKVVKYSNRCLLQIEFDESGKRLLDPKIAKIKPV